MSEERRKRKQSREEKTAKGGKWELRYGIPILILACLFLGWRYHVSHRYDAFAKCLAAHQAKMYGLYWCPHCADQKAMFGAAFRYVPYQECAIKDKPGELAEPCKVAGVKLFPSWQFGSNAPTEGVFPLEELSDKTGCSLP